MFIHRTLLILLPTTLNLTFAQLSSTDGPFSTAITACPSGAAPMNVSDGNFGAAQKLYGNNGNESTAPAWIASYNTDVFGGDCIAFYGGSVNVPYNCSTPYPTLCHTIKD